VTVVFADADVDAVAQRLTEVAGLVFDEGRRPGLVAALAHRWEILGTPDISDYLRLLGSPEGADERQRLLDAVTIQETYFFRNGPQMRALREQVLPDLVRRAAAERRELRIWSAGCSTGEEPYSLAMLALETMEELGLFVRACVVGTDVSASAVNAARQGRYRGRTLDLAEHEFADRWFVAASDGYSDVHPEVRALVDLRVHNLVSDPAPFAPGEADLVVCRNVTIYFAKPTTARVIAGFHDVLAPHGYLLLGHAETLWQVSEAFDLLPVGEAFVYRKSEPARSARVAINGADRPAARGHGPRKQRRSFLRRADVTVVRATPTATPEQAPASQELAGAEEALLAGRYVEALERAQRAIALDPLAIEGYALAGRAAVALGDDRAALGPLRKAVFLEPGCAEAHFTLAGVLARAGQHAAASAAYRAAAAAVPTTSAARLHRMLDGRDPASLIELCERLAASTDRAAQAAVNAGGA
jgi:chemotaxis protein methyltransferase CheR